MNVKPKFKAHFLLSVFLVILITGCQTAAKHQSELPSTKERDLTVGTVQKEIREGMSAADVATTLGAPNIVTKDSEGDETWIYDKIASEASYSRSSASVGAGAAGQSIATLLLGFGTASKSSGATSTTQRTLTVVIKFDESSKVKSFSYHSRNYHR